MAPATDLYGDNAAWRIQVWASFWIAFGTTLVGIANLPTDLWTRAFLGMGVLFTTGSTFTLAKTVRDQFEARRLHNQLNEAKAARILRELDEQRAASPETMQPEVVAANGRGA